MFSIKVEVVDKTSSKGNEDGLSYFLEVGINVPNLTASIKINKSQHSTYPSEGPIYCRFREENLGVCCSIKGRAKKLGEEDAEG